jgi:hypothetical protein
MIKPFLLGALTLAAFAPALAVAQPQPSMAPPGQDSSSPPDPWNGGPPGVEAREAWIEGRIHAAVTDGNMETDQSSSALNELADIRKIDAVDRAGGPLNDVQRQDLKDRLDRLHIKVIKAISHNSVQSY